MTTPEMLESLCKGCRVSLRSDGPEWTLILEPHPEFVTKVPRFYRGPLGLVVQRAYRDEPDDSQQMCPHGCRARGCRHQLSGGRGYS